MILVRSVLIADSVKPVCTLEAAVHDAVVKIRIQNVSPVDRSATCIYSKHALCIHILLCVEHLRHSLYVLDTIETVISNSVLTCLSLLCSHENDTVRTTRTVDGAGCSILEDVDALDIRRVKGVDVTTCYTVDHIERLVRTDSTHTTDRNLEAFTRLT